MRLTKIQAADFLSFGTLDLQLSPGLTVITGPNGVGKTNLGRCIDAIRTVLGHHAGIPAADRLDLYQSAGRYGATAFRLAIGLELDQQWERDLVLAFVRAAIACDAQAPKGLDALVRAQLMEESLALLWSGTVHLHYDSAMRNPWFGAWEFYENGQAWHFVLAGSSAGELRAGRADRSMIPSGHVPTLTDRWPMSDLRSDIPSATKLDLVDFRKTLPAAGQSVSVRVSPPNDAHGPIPTSLRELLIILGLSETDGRYVEFGNVISAVLQRGIVLTDNRRVPLNRRFTHDIFEKPIELRDGSKVAAELYRLRNGNIYQRKHYAEIEDTFTRLTGRTLGLRGGPESIQISRDTLAIEPTIVDEHGEQPIEFSGAGVQEALVLSALLPGPPGRSFILDEPAVNLEPTVQRRLISTLRNVGQCVVITHSPDLVPADGPDDLANIVRLAPGPEGATIRRVGTLDRKDHIRWVKLLEPTHVRALLFAAHVILCEGSTEIGALPRWWSDTSSTGLPDPEATNTPIVSVGGDFGYGTYIEYLDAFGIPWAIVSDGPALRRTSIMAKQLRKLERRPLNEPGSDDFEEWRNYWQQAGVFTFANQFGDDGSKGGEFEELLVRVDPDLLDMAAAEVGRNSKPRIGAFFAAEHPEPPQEVLDLYRSIMRHFGYNTRS